MEREYFNVTLKTQSKKAIALYETAMATLDGIEHDRWCERWFKGAQEWRNSAHLRISLPPGCRWKFISLARAWCSPQRRVKVQDFPDSLYRPLRGKHDDLPLRRSYNLHLGGQPWVKDYAEDGSYQLYEGAEFLCAVLDGELEPLLRAEGHSDLG